MEQAGDNATSWQNRGLKKAEAGHDHDTSVSFRHITDFYELADGANDGGTGWGSPCGTTASGSEEHWEYRKNSDNEEFFGEE